MEYFKILYSLALGKMMRALIFLNSKFAKDRQLGKIRKMKYSKTEKPFSLHRLREELKDS